MAKSGSFKVFREELEREFSIEKVKAKLDAELAELHAAMTAVVPVRTGFLKSQGQHWSTSDDDEWTGYLSYETVDYAIYALNKNPQSL